MLDLGLPGSSGVSCISYTVDLCHQSAMDILAVQMEVQRDKKVTCSLG